MEADSVGTIVSGFVSNLELGLTEISAALWELFTSSSTFGSVVPGILETQGAGADAVETSPTVLQLLDSPVDVDPNTTEGSGINGAGFYAGDGSLADRFDYLANPARLQSNILISEASADEHALDAMDLDGDQNVTWKEAFDVLVVGQTVRFLNTVDVLDVVGGGDGVDSDDLAAYLDIFFDLGMTLPGYLSDIFDMAVSSANVSAGGDMKFNLDLRLSFDHSDTLYLGYEAEQLAIVTDPTLPGSTPSPTQLAVDAGVHFRALIIGFTDVGGSVSSGDFIFAVPDKPNDANDGMVVSVEIDSSLSIDNNGAPVSRTFNINVGFLGATVTDGEILLDMDQMGGAADPSNPDALGFSLNQQGGESCRTRRSRRSWRAASHRRRRSSFRPARSICSRASASSWAAPGRRAISRAARSGGSSSR
jgi:hypothetical protein